MNEPVSQPVPVEYKHTLHVELDALDVFGYLGHTLRAITNTSGRAIDIVLCLEPDTPEHVTLGRDESIPLDIDAWECIRQRFMPYIVSKEPQTVSVRVDWIV